MWARLKKGSSEDGVSKKGGGALKYRLLLQKDPNDAKTLSKLGAIQLEAGDVDESLKNLRKAVELGYDDGTFWRTYGRALMQSWHRDYDSGDSDPEDAEDAVEAFENALKHVENATNPKVYLELASASAAMGAVDGALQVYANVIVNFPQYAGLSVAIFKAAVLSMHPDVADLDVCERYFGDIMMNPPAPYTEALLLFQLARVYEMKGKRKTARAAFREVFGKLTLKERGWVYFP